MSGGWVTTQSWPESSLVVIEFRINQLLAQMARTNGLAFLEAQKKYKEKCDQWHCISGRHGIWNLSYIPPKEQAVTFAPPPAVASENS